MPKDVKMGNVTRRTFARHDDILPMPNLIEVQKKSYQWFIEEGLQEVLREVSPITDNTGTLNLEFIDFTVDEKLKYTVEECKERDVNYSAPLRVRARLVNKETGEVKEQEVYMGEFPLMTESGTFIINGAERVIVSQLVRSPGIYYDRAFDKVGKAQFSATVIPYRGAWLEYETDSQDVFYVRIDKSRKLPVTTLLRALGCDTDDKIYALFGDDEKIRATLEKDTSNAEAEKYGTSPREEALKEVYRKLRPGEPPLMEPAEKLINNYFFDPRRYDLRNFGRFKFNNKLALAERIEGQVLAAPVVSPVTGEILADQGQTVTGEMVRVFEQNAVNEVFIALADRTVKVFGNNMVHPQDFVDAQLCEELGFNERVYYPLLAELIEQAGGDRETLKKLLDGRRADLIPKYVLTEDVFASVNYVLCLSHDLGSIDDIDHLGNRRLRCVGELMQNQFRIGFARMDRVIRERMTIQDLDVVTPQALINIRPVVASLKEFFGSSPLSQFMDQTNPLAELTHKRRLSALGPGGLTRDRAGFEVRDVHYTHYGRMCPVETPEGPNIGLISYLATYARINDFGFLEAPYRKVDPVTHKVTDQIEYMSADKEDRYCIAQAKEPFNEDGSFVNKEVVCRYRDEILELPYEKIDYVDVSPRMVVSVATAFIPFLENDDTSRALMGSNMQKQAVPLLVPESPIVATGMEYRAGIDSCVCVLARQGGTVTYVSADSISVLQDDGKEVAYRLIKFKRSNQGTCVNQRPIVKVGQRVEQGDVLADGPSTVNGEISLGRNMLIGFMTWEGYNYEDAVLINERLVREDVYTSLHIEEYSLDARDTKLGPEEITRDIPNVGEDALKDLGPDGVIRKGAEVRAGDILVGKVTPKGETELTAEERLLRAIFGDKAREVRDTSLRLPHGESGIVVDVRTFCRADSDELPAGTNKVVRVYIAQKRKISVGDKMAGRHGNKGVISRILPPEDMPFLPDGTPLDIVLNPLGVPSRMNIGQVLEVHLSRAAKKLGYRVMTPVFDGATEEDIFSELCTAGLYREIFPNESIAGKDLYFCEEDGSMRKLTAEERADEDFVRENRLANKLRLADGKTVLYDGRTGEAFDNPVTVGYMYFLKLLHLVDDKIHARSTGPYSLVTQQPLGGKAQFGGQRFGEMEVWALEAYGAAYTLQEILTVKSDDVTGRVKAYEAIVKGQSIPTPGVPESFRVLIKELQSIGLDIKVLDRDNNEVDLKDKDDDEFNEPVRPMRHVDWSQHDDDESTEEMTDEEPLDDGLEDELDDVSDDDAFIEEEFSKFQVDDEILDGQFTLDKEDE